MLKKNEKMMIGNAWGQATNIVVEATSLVTTMGPAATEAMVKMTVQTAKAIHM